jgi:hypothetical protein
MAFPKTAQLPGRGVTDGATSYFRVTRPWHEAVLGLSRLDKFAMGRLAMTVVGLSVMGYPARRCW